MHSTKKIQQETKMRSLIIGAGEVGQSLKKVLSFYHETFIRDIDSIEVPKIQVLNICYPDHQDFVKTTQNYIEEYKPLLTIINSSVAVGTTTKCGGDIVYSPIRGRHPDNGLANELKLFTKFIGCRNELKRELAKIYYELCEWEVKTSDNPESLEYLKLMSNVHMGLEIAWRQEIGRMMKKFEIQDKDYEEWEKTYSEGYMKLGQTHLIRPQLRPDPIGGHCILPCTEILKEQYPSKALDFILESNDAAKNAK